MTSGGQSFRGGSMWSLGVPAQAKPTHAAAAAFFRERPAEGLFEGGGAAGAGGCDTGADASRPASWKAPASVEGGTAAGGEVSGVLGERLVTAGLPFSGGGGAGA